MRPLPRCKKDERLAALFSFPSDVDPDVALDQLHALKFGRTRRKTRPVSLSELENYYNPLALRKLLDAGPHKGASIVLQLSSV